MVNRCENLFFKGLVVVLIAHKFNAGDIILLQMRLKQTVIFGVAVDQIGDLPPIKRLLQHQQIVKRKMIRNKQYPCFR